MKKFCTVILAALLCINLSACGGASGEYSEAEKKRPEHILDVDYVINNCIGLKKYELRELIGEENKEYLINHMERPCLVYAIDSSGIYDMDCNGFMEFGYDDNYGDRVYRYDYHIGIGYMQYSLSTTALFVHDTYSENYRLSEDKIAQSSLSSEERRTLYEKIKADFIQKYGEYTQLSDHSEDGFALLKYKYDKTPFIESTYWDLGEESKLELHLTVGDVFVSYTEDPDKHTGKKHYEDKSDGVVGDNDGNGKIDEKDWEDEWKNYLNDKMAGY